MGGLPGQPDWLPVLESAGVFGLATVPVSLSGHAMLLWMTVVAGIGRQLVEEVLHGGRGHACCRPQMVGNPEVERAVHLALPLDRVLQATVSKAFSTFCS